MRAVEAVNYQGIGLARTQFQRLTLQPLLITRCLVVIKSCRLRPVNHSFSVRREPQSCYSPSPFRALVSRRYSNKHHHPVLLRARFGVRRIAARRRCQRGGTAPARVQRVRAPPGLRCHVNASGWWLGYVRVARNQWLRGVRGSVCTSVRVPAWALFYNCVVYPRWQHAGPRFTRRPQYTPRSPPRSYCA